MIIFELDDVLADTNHRRKYIEAPEDLCHLCYEILMEEHEHMRKRRCICGNTPSRWKYSKKKYNNACSTDIPIKPVIHLLEHIAEGKQYNSEDPFVDYVNIEIWTSRCESTREKTEKWLRNHVKYMSTSTIVMKMRPIGDKTPNHILKQNWCDNIMIKSKLGHRLPIEMVFATDPHEILMWKQIGVFVFDCNQKVL